MARKIYLTLVDNQNQYTGDADIGSKAVLTDVSRTKLGIYTRLRDAEAGARHEAGQNPGHEVYIFQAISGYSSTPRTAEKKVWNSDGEYIPE